MNLRAGRDEPCSKGIPIYVFVLRSILDMLSIWRANPAADFSSPTDSPELFRFVSEIREATADWVFPFDTAQDITSTLRTQLAYLFSDALALRTRASRSGALTSKYSGISGREFRLIIEKPRGWEYRLFSEAFQREISSSADLRRDWEHNVILGSQSLLTPKQFTQWIQEKNSEAMQIAANFNALFDRALITALGPPGQPGDPEGIVYIAKRLGDMYRSFMEWKLAFS